MEALVFFLSNGDQYTHLKPLGKYLQSHLEGRNGHAHDGGFLNSFVPKQVQTSSSSNSSAFAESVETFMEDIANNRFDTKLKHGAYQKITGNNISWTLILLWIKQFNGAESKICRIKINKWITYRLIALTSV